MSQKNNNQTTRRNFVKTAGKLAAVSALAGISIPHVHAAKSNTIQIALVGCGGRGTGAVADALAVKNGPIKVVAMADVFQHRLDGSHDQLTKKFPDAFKFDVSKDRQFIGLDAYKSAIDCLKPGDVAIFATPPAFRWVQFQYAIQKGVNVFMEKPVTVDGPTTKRMIQLAEEASKKSMKVGVGLMVRHCRSRQELKKRIDDGQIGDLLMLRAYRMHGPVGSAFSPAKPEDVNELDYQISKFHSFLWASGGLFSDFYIHQIDECCWMKGSWPVQAHATGGRHYRGNNVDQNFDTYSVEYTFEDGAKLFLDGRTMNGCNDDMASYAHGTKGMGIVSFSGHEPGKCRIFKGQKVKSEDMTWAFPQPEKSPYKWEWEDLIEAIRDDKPYNEVKRGAEASLVTSMGRMAAHTGQIVTFDDILNCDHEFAPGLDKVTRETPPLVANAEGKYPIPMPGIKKKREY